MNSHRSQAICRAIVFKRDKGVCALCGLDTEAVRKELEAMKEALGAEDFVVFRAAYLTARGLPTANKSYWIADHYPIPFTMGGPNVASNLRTLCTRPACVSAGAPLKMLAKLSRIKARPLLKTSVKR